MASLQHLRRQFVHPRVLNFPASGRHLVHAAGQRALEEIELSGGQTAFHHRLGFVVEGWTESDSNFHTILELTVDQIAQHKDHRVKRRVVVDAAPHHAKRELSLVAGGEDGEVNREFFTLSHKLSFLFADRWLTYRGLLLF